MAVQNSFSEYQQAAWQKWPTSTITGDGPFALVCSVTESVHLYSFYMLAMTEIARDHSNWRCKDSHRMVELKPVARRETIRRNPAEMERD